MSESFKTISAGGGDLLVPAHFNQTEKIDQMSPGALGSDEQELRAQREIVGTYGLGSIRNESVGDRKAEALAEDLEKSIKDMLRPENIIDLKAQLDHGFEKELNRQKSPVESLRDKGGLQAENNDRLSQDMKSKLIEAYTQTGVKKGEVREVPESVKAEIAKLMNLSYEELESRINKTPKAGSKESQVEAEVDNEQPNTEPGSVGESQSEPAGLEGLKQRYQDLEKTKQEVDKVLENLPKYQIGRPYKMDGKRANITDIYQNAEGKWVYVVNIDNGDGENVRIEKYLQDKFGELFIEDELGVNTNDVTGEGSTDVEPDESDSGESDGVSGEDEPESESGSDEESDADNSENDRRGWRQRFRDLYYAPFIYIRNINVGRSAANVETPDDDPENETGFSRRKKALIILGGIAAAAVAGGAIYYGYKYGLSTGGGNKGEIGTTMTDIYGNVVPDGMDQVTTAAPVETVQQPIQEAAQEYGYSTTDKYPWNWAERIWGADQAMDQIKDLAEKAQDAGHSISWHNVGDANQLNDWLTVDGESGTEKVVGILSQYAK